MDALELLTSRTSALRLIEPAPGEAEMALVFASVARTPDHGRLRPWRFVIVSTAQREKFGELLAQSLSRSQPDASAEQLQRERDKALRAPMILVVCAHIQDHPKIPAIEQFAAASAAAQNVMLALQAQGYGAMWKTGAPAYDASVRQALGFAETDQMVGFLYVGTRADQPAPRPQAPASDWVRNWSP